MEKREKVSRILLVLFSLFFIWSLLQFLAPILLPNSSLEDLSGSTGVLDNKAAINDLSFPWKFIYTTGDRLCHQKTDRSFQINNNQMPFCSRCTAIWTGMTIGIGLMIFYKIPLNNKFLIAIILSIVPIGIDGFGQLFGFWESTNIIRIVTGLLIGIICGIAIGLIVDETKDLKLKRKT
jgi:uncharacterized membrane protein